MTLLETSPTGSAARDAAVELRKCAATPNPETPAPENPSEKQIDRDMAASLGDAAGFSVMVGAGETYLPAYALALGMGEVAAGLISSLPMLAGAALQLASPWAVRKFNSRRGFVVSSAALQAASLVLLPLAMAAGPLTATMVFVAAGLYWAFGLATAPVWNTWIEELVPAAVRTRFFAHRGRISQACVLVGFVLGGILLQSGKWADTLHWGAFSAWTMVAFAALFGVSAICRAASAWSLSRQSEPSRGNIIDSRVGWREWKKRLRGDAGTKLVIYLLAVQVAVQVSGPFFTPLMLSESEFGFSYLQFMVLLSVAYVGKVVMFPTWGRLARKLGPKRLLWVGGVALAPIPALCVASGNYYFLLLVQLYSGIAWAAYELAMLLMFFDSVPRHERTSVLTMYNFGNAAALVVGSLCGGAILHALGEGHVGYVTVFLLSAVCRTGTIGLLFLIPKVHAAPIADSNTIDNAGDGGAVVLSALPGLPDDGLEQRLAG